MRKDLFDKFQGLIGQYQALPADAADPFQVTMQEIHSQTEATIDGRRTILCGTNNYMGMTFDEDAIKAAEEALHAFGTGSTGSRVLNGTFAGHRALEETIRKYYGTKHAIVFSTGYLANLGFLCTVPGKNDYIVIDADSHASIYDGCAQGNSNLVRFRHNNPEDLEKRLSRLPEDAAVLVVVEGIYSMLGDVAPLKEIIEVKKKYGAAILVDEAHSMGFCGKTGRGVSQAVGVEDDVDFIIGTFSKSVGTVGGFAVSNHPSFEVLRLAARPYVFTASLPPSVVASAACAIKKIEKADDTRAKLWANARQLHSGLKKAGFTLATQEAESPIIAVCLPDTVTTVYAWSALLKAGVYVNMAVPPATPGLYLLRCSVCASHSPEQVEKIIGIFEGVAKEIGLNLNEKPLSSAAE